ncbi:hypothetical protein BGZ60DRAFT_411729 [Tricladium varicosporioides]|nr:hypothetical protein BGZ60DRAFT_411729 [Hymenoscyphus varicosporioides]
MTAIRILNAITALITVSVISTVLAYAAVVFTQKSRNDKELNLAQTLSLANKDWADLWALWYACKPCPPHLKKGKKGPSSQFLWIGFALLFIGAIQHPLQQLLVSTKALQIATCLDFPYTYPSSANCGYDQNRTWERVGFDPQPYVLQLVPRNLVVQDITKNLIMVSDDIIQPNLWAEDYVRHSPTTYELGTGHVYPDWFVNIHKAGFFTSTVPAGATTGVLRQHAIRMNSVVECSVIDNDQFPAVCPGSNPFTASFPSSVVLLGSNASNTISTDIRICSPGNQTHNPWLSHRNSQSITEELFIGVPPTRFYPSDYHTMRCHAETTRGYFELGNVHNGNNPGPILDLWPDDNDINANFDDDNPGEVWNMTRWNRYTIPPSFQNPWSTTYSYDRIDTPGPLQTTAIALFGNTSFLSNLFQPSAINTTASQIANLLAICRMDTIPYRRMPPDSDVRAQSSQEQDTCQIVNQQRKNNFSKIENYVPQLASDFMEGFRLNDSAQQALGMGMFFANRAVLTHGASVDRARFVRPLRTSHGTIVLKPDMAFASMIVISSFIGMQVIGLLLVAIYAYKTPTWTATLDARALAAIGAGMVEVLPNEGLERREWEKVDLKQANGVLGYGPTRPARERLAFSERVKARARRARDFQAPLSSRGPGANGGASV